MGTHLGLWEYEGGEGQSVAAMEGQQEGMQRTGTLGRSWGGPCCSSPSVCAAGLVETGHTRLGRASGVLQGHGDAITKVLRGEPSTSLFPGWRERGSEGNSGH